METNMENDGTAPQQPVQDDPQATAEPEVVEQEQQVEEDAPQEQAPEQAINEGQDAPETEKEETPPSDPDFEPLPYSNFNQGQYEFKPAEDGSVDPYQVAQQIEARLLNTMKFQQQEQRAWQQIDKKYSDKLTPARRELILNARIANAVNGKDTKLTTIADKIMSEFTTAKSEGRAEASVSRKVQKAASLETATSNTGESRSNEEVYDRIISGDKGATENLLSEWLKAGKI
jgi:hypothetical protein